MRLLWVLGALLIGASALSLSIGAVSIGPRQQVAILAHQVGLETAWSFERREEVVLMTVRAPRVALGLLVGAGLGVAGASLQGLFRNPLADPGLIGVSSGAALAAVAMTVGGAHMLGSASGPFMLSVSAFIGGLLSVLVVYRVGTTGGRTSVATMLLAGIAINALAAAGTGVFLFASDDQQLRDFIFWTLGGLGGTTWRSVAGGAPLLIAGSIPLLLLARPLNALLLGQSEAHHLGVHVDRVKRAVMSLSAVTVGVAVALTGIIGFIGLVTPHLIRLALGPDHRYVLPGAALLGGILLVLADLTARTIVSPAELPVGIVTALIGAPFFLWLIVRDRGQASWDFAE